MPDGDKDVAGVIAPPPVILVVCVALGAGLQRLYPLPMLSASISRVLAFTLWIAALLLFGMALREFVRNRTPVATREPTRAIATGGPYAFTRNPIYLSFALMQTAMAFQFDSAWLLVTLVLSIRVLTKGVIEREERYLEHRFGDEYTRYRNSVRRWI